MTIKNNAAITRVKSIATVLINAIENNAKDIQDSLHDEDVLNLARTEYILKDLQELKKEIEVLQNV